MKKKAPKVEEETRNSPPNPWAKRLARMKAYQQRHIDNWEKNAKLLYGEKDKTPRVAYAWGLVKGLETAIYVQNPSFSCWARDRAYAEAADLVTRIASYDMDQMDVKSVGNLALMDCFVAGYAVSIETCETEKRVLRFPTSEEDDAKEKGEESESEDTGDEAVEDQQFRLSRIAPEDFLNDPDGRKLDLSDSRYCAIAFYPTLESLKNDPSFTLPKDIDGFPECSEGSRMLIDRATNASMQDSYTLSIDKQVETDSAFKTICVWEIHDKVNEQLIYLLHHDHLEIKRAKMPVKLRIGGRRLYPMTVMAFHPRPDQFYPTPELSLVRHQLTEINEIDQKISETCNETWRKWAVNGAIFRPEDLRKIVDKTKKYDFLMVEKDQLDEFMGAGGQGSTPTEFDIKRNIVQLDDPALTRDLPARLSMLEGQIQQILGYGPTDRGGLPQVRTAREAVAINDAKQSRLQKRFDAVADWMRMVLTKHVQMLQQLQEMERYVKVLPMTAGAKVFFKTYNREDIEKGDFYFEVAAGSSGPQNTESQQQKAMQGFQAVAPVLQAAGLPITGAFMEVARVMQWDWADDVFKNQKAVAKQGAAMLSALQTTQAKDPNFVAQMVNVFSQLVMATLTPEEIRTVQSQVMEGPQQAPGKVPDEKSKGMRGDQANPAGYEGM